ncbi:N-acetyllactosaminide beta-1,3-N-acetylglucosaminyltransferase 3-like [Scophthalmus maximus]|uniref:N-acetyllactosaminide beta-1,3-N-acetylglucosaminyltransferase 3-like n=1 Tax=Scophthalmus maximus TaxID=52904 RepID=UPI001FA8E883|nr:N-acetyllactosaminide beta-1,3-N-acetylglucosaminyltransferase 3-like [Scophthalmus maximus]
MMRVLGRTEISTSTLLLVVTLVMVICLLYDYNDNQISHLQKAVMEDDNQTMSPAQNASHPTSWPPCEPNMAAADIRDFSSLPKTLQDFLYFQHCQQFPMLLDVPDKCGGAEASDGVFLLLVIKSSPGNYENREVLRKTWAKERLHNGALIRRLFITGTEQTGFEKARQNQLLQLEQSEYGDILQWDFTDSFYNLTLKQVLFLQWIDRNCPHVRFLLNGDDDVFANTGKMVEYLQGLDGNDGDKHLFSGNVIYNSSPIRSPSSKYFIPMQVQASNSYPPYCSGGGFLLSGYTAMVIYKMSTAVPLLPIDDVYIGMCLAKAGLHPAYHMGILTNGLYIPSKKIDKYDPCIYRDFLLVHRFLPAQIYLMWHRVNYSNLKCSSFTKH